MLRLELTTFSRRVSMSMSVCPPHRTQTGRRSNNNNTLCKREAQRSRSAVSPHTVSISDSIRVMLLPEEEQTKHVVLSHRHLAFHEAAQPDRGAEPAIKPSRWGSFPHVCPEPIMVKSSLLAPIITNKVDKDPFFLATFAASTACCCGTAAGTRTG